MPIIGAPIARAVEAVPGSFSEARNVVADQLGDFRSSQNIGKDIASKLRDAQKSETTTNQAQVDQTNEAAQAQYEADNAAREQQIAQAEQASTQQTAQHIGDIHPSETGDVIGDTIRENNRGLQRNADVAYDVAAEAPGAIKAEAMPSLYPRAMAALEQSGRALSGDTKAANNVRAALKSLSNMEVPKDMYGIHIPAEGATEIDVQGINAFRKQINSLARNAQTPEDAAAAKVFTKAFDAWQNDAMQIHDHLVIRRQHLRLISGLTPCIPIA